MDGALALCSVFRLVAMAEDGGEESRARQSYQACAL